MPTTLNALEIRRALGRKEWGVPAAFGPDGAGWIFEKLDRTTRIIVTEAPVMPGSIEVWRHASISHPDRMPTYKDLVLLHQVAFEGYAYQVFAPPEEHINIHEFALHLYGYPDGRRILPNFGWAGSI